MPEPMTGSLYQFASGEISANEKSCLGENAAEKILVFTDHRRPRVKQQAL